MKWDVGKNLREKRDLTKSSKGNFLDEEEHNSLGNLENKFSAKFQNGK